MKKEALLYEKRDGGTACCSLCAHRCVIADGHSGICGVRANIGGTLFATTYSEVIQASIDRLTVTIPSRCISGSATYSLASIGCNFTCSFCKNRQISRLKKSPSDPRMGYEMSPEDIVRNAVGNGCRSVSFGYTEPTVYFEYACDVARLAKQSGLAVCFHTNGYLTAEALDVISPYVDAVTIDLKGSGSFYRRECGAELAPVIDTIRRCAERNCLMGISTAVIPGANDSIEDIERIVSSIAGVSKNIPWRINRFIPTNTGCREMTTDASLSLASGIARSAGLTTVSVDDSPLSA